MYVLKFQTLIKLLNQSLCRFDSIQLAESNQFDSMLNVNRLESIQLNWLNFSTQIDSTLNRMNRKLNRIPILIHESHNSGFHAVSKSTSSARSGGLPVNTTALRAGRG